MASTSNSKRPSSSSSSYSKWRYDVFLSFRGEDTRNNFTSHLYKALDHGNIETFIDDEELPRGEEIGPELLKSIEESRIAIIVFSKTYAHSKWCLDELVKIMECQKEKGQKVFPIFYHVEPSEVRNQTGIYGEAFNNHESNADEEKKKKQIEEWRAALRKAGNLSGFPVQDRSESKFIEEIISEIKRLIPKLVHVGENMVGMDENLREVKSLIDAQSNEVSMVGIYGLGGIGKTTIAKVVYNEMLDQFKCHSFLENVREKSNDDRGLLRLQEKLLCDILMEKNMELSNIDGGIKMIKSKCCVEKVLIVLDDVNCPEQLKYLAPNSECFGQGSIIIVTTRNKRCLDVHKSYSSYEAKGLAHEKDKELFCWKAFQQDHPENNYVDLSNRILDYAKGLPLALVVLGSFLFQRDVDEWESTLDKLKTNPLEDIQKVLQISYDGLDDKCKKLFLDIACFFKDQDEKFVTRILEGCKFHPKIGLRVLRERCLISITDGTIRMHDLLQEMGWAIVRQIDPERPEKWSRLWELEDIESVLTQNKGTENIEGIFIIRPYTTKKWIQLSTEAFRKMNRLRLLKVAGQLSGDPLMIELPSQDFELPCHDLVYFHWESYPLESLPSNFHADNLVELNLQWSNIEHLWERNMLAKKLKVINLSYSYHLVDISSISSVPNLEILILTGCISLQSLPSNLHKLKCLRKLCCYGCSKIDSFPDINEEMRSLRELNLRQTGIRELPSSIGHLNGLEELDLSYCENLLDNIGSLKALKSLSLTCCTSLKSLPDSIGSLKALQVLHLSEYTSLKSLPDSIESLKALQVLHLSECTSLKSLPDSIGSLKALQELHLLECTSLKSLPDSIGSLKALQELHLLECTSLKSLPDSIGSLEALQELHLSKCTSLKSLPDSIGSLKALQRLDLSACTSLESLPDSMGSLKALEWLDLSFCDLESLPEGIYNLSSLKNLVTGFCPKFLTELGMDLGCDEHSSTRLYLTCHISNLAVIWENGSVSSLKALNPRCLSSLVELSVRNSHLVDILTGGFYLSLLEKLSVRNFHIIEGGIAGDIFRDIFHLSSLVELSLTECNLMEIRTLQSIWNLPSLRRLHLRNCNLREGEIPDHVWHLSSLEELFLDENHFSSLPAGISQLTNLRVLNLSHCKNLQQIPELPSSLRFLDARYSGGISSSPSPLPIYSMFNCFESDNCFNSDDCFDSDNCFDLDNCFDPYYELFYGHSIFTGVGISFVIPSSGGILDWMSYQSIKGDKVMIELPPDWYENKDLLGFALFCVYESWNESTDAFDNDRRYYLSCVWEIQGNNELPPVESWELTSKCVNNCASDGAWVIFYPKVALKEAIKKLGRYNQWTRFMASFYVLYSFIRLKKCGIRFIYTEDCEQKHPTMAQGSTSHGNFGEHGSVREDTNSKAHNKRNPAEQSPREESHH